MSLGLRSQESEESSREQEKINSLKDTNIAKNHMIITWVDRYVNSQSSMNSHRWNKPISFASGISLIRMTIESTIAFL